MVCLLRLAPLLIFRSPLFLFVSGLPLRFLKCVVVSGPCYLFERVYLVFSINYVRQL
jgi:hypothetical protein